MRAILWCEWNLFNVIPHVCVWNVCVNLKLYQQTQNIATIERLSLQTRSSVTALTSTSAQGLTGMADKACPWPKHHAKAGTQPDAETSQNKRIASI